MTNDAVFRPLDSLQLMAYIIERCNALGVGRLNITKLQKLMYCCFGVVFAAYDIRLCDENPEAWQYGPVFPRTLLAMKTMGSIGEFEQTYRNRDDSFNEQKTKFHYVFSAIDKTLTFFGNYSASQLSNWSHLEGSPWNESSNNGKNLYRQIDCSKIKTYFKENVI